MGVNALSYLKQVGRRTQDQQRLLPAAGPTRIQLFYRQIGHLKEKASIPARLKEWLTSWHSGYLPLHDVRTEDEYEADGRDAMRAAFAKALGNVPGGKVVNALDSEFQAVRIWRAAQNSSDTELKEALENLALLKEWRATGQGMTAGVSGVAALTSFPFLEKLAKPFAKLAIKWLTRKLAAAVATSDRAALAEIVHRHALAELEAQLDESAEDEPVNDPSDYEDARHAMYALVVLRVSLGLLRQDLADRKDGEPLAAGARAALLEAIK